MHTTTLGKRSTAEQALRGISLDGKRAIVTGASSGLGQETARVLALAGAEVTLAVRDVAAGEAVAAKLRALQPDAKLVVRKLDLSDLGSVRRFADARLAEGGPLDLLINNAGIMATPLGFTAQGHESQVGTNHLGHFLLTTLLIPLLAENARVVTVSSDLHGRADPQRLVRALGTGKDRTEGYSPFGTYGDSKLANVLFTRALAKRLPPGRRAFSLHPGVIGTNLSRHLGVLSVAFTVGAKLFSKSIPQGAATTVYAATAPELDGHSGAYLIDCALGQSSKAGRDDALAEQVWALSEQAVKAPTVATMPVPTEAREAARASR